MFFCIKCLDFISVYQGEEQCEFKLLNICIGQGRLFWYELECNNCQGVLLISSNDHLQCSSQSCRDRRQQEIKDKEQTFIQLYTQEFGQDDASFKDFRYKLHKPSENQQQLLICTKKCNTCQEVSDTELKLEKCRKCEYNKAIQQVSSLQCSYRFNYTFKLTNNPTDYNIRPDSPDIERYIICQLECLICQSGFIVYLGHHILSQKCEMCKFHTQYQINDYIRQFYDTQYEFAPEDGYYNGTGSYRRFSYDILLINENIIIEYDGEQHFVPVAKFNQSLTLEQIQERDIYKDQFALHNGYKMIRMGFDCIRGDWGSILKSTIEDLLNNKSKIVFLGDLYNEKRRLDSQAPFDDSFVVSVSRKQKEVQEQIQVQRMR